MNGACRLAGMDQRRAIDESDGRLSVEEPQLPEPWSEYVPEYSEADISRGVPRDEVEDSEGEWGYDLSDGNVYE